MICASCAASPPSPSISVAARCPALSSGIVNESRTRPQIVGKTGVEVSGKLISQMHRKNAALKRAVAAYRACRKA